MLSTRIQLLDPLRLSTNEMTYTVSLCLLYIIETVRTNRSFEKSPCPFLTRPKDCGATSTPMVHLIQSQPLVESLEILAHLDIAPQLEEEDGVGDSDDGGPEDPDVVGLDVDDKDGDEEHEEEVEHVEEAAKAPGNHILCNQLFLQDRIGNVFLERQKRKRKKSETKKHKIIVDGTPAIYEPNHMWP